MFLRLFFEQRNNCFRFFAGDVFRRNFCNTVSTEKNNTGYKYLLFLDLEATCDQLKRINQEIIEFPCIKVNVSNFVEESRFHHYVQPVVNPLLSQFCIELTGILQEVVDEAKKFPEVLELFEEWRQKEGLTDENSLYVTSGDWDLGHMIPRQCLSSNLEVPSHMKEWADIKKIFGNNKKQFYNSFSSVMKHYSLEFEGRCHSGIDDTLNMCRAAKKMVGEGIQFQPTSRLVDFKVEYLIKPIKEIQTKSNYRKRRKENIRPYLQTNDKECERNPVAAENT